MGSGKFNHKFLSKNKDLKASEMHEDSPSTLLETVGT